MSIKLWHCKDTRSLRTLWTLEELKLDYELEVLPFPPRLLKPEYLDINPLGTVPFMRDGNISMTESTATCHYLVEKYKKYEFGLQPNEADYADYLNWLYHSDATLTFPQTLYFRYTMLESDERKQPQVANDYRVWYLSRLKKLNNHIINGDFLVADRFTIADIAVGYALYFGEIIGLSSDYASQTMEYLERLKSRAAFIRATKIES